MKVAFCIREDYLSKKGGDTIQLMKTKEYLEKIFNIESKIITDPSEIDRYQADIYHIFNLQTQKITEEFLNKAKSLNKKIALSTIFWNPTYNMCNIFSNKLNIDNNERNLKLISNILNITSKTLGKPNSLSKGYKEYLIKMIENSDVLLPNSIEEMESLCEFTKSNINKFIDKTNVVVNAVDINLECENNIENIPSNYVLECARIEPTKNQYAVVKALYNRKDIPIVFLGNQKADIRYFEKVKKIANDRGNVYFVDEVSHSEVIQYYKNAAVHILPSFRESPGLSTIEALYSGCKIVVSDKRFCPVDSYFKNIATMINPMDIDSIHDGIIEEYDKIRDIHQIKSSLKNSLTWENAAKQTMNGYMLALNS